MSIEDAIRLTRHFYGVYTAARMDKARSGIERADAETLADYFMAALDALEEQEERET